MRILRGALMAAVLILPLAACSEDKPITMPDVVGKSLDVASSDVERAGFKDEVEVLGGGLFGIVDESNWTVCSQEPPGGSEITSAPRLTVDRTCGGEDDSEASADPSEEPTTEAEPASTTAETTAVEAEPTDTEGTELAETGGEVLDDDTDVLTVDNNADLAALIAAGSSDWDAFAEFAARYEGRTIELDLWVADVQRHGDYETRFDYLLFAGRYNGDFEASYQGGPNFKFEDVNYSNLELTGANQPDTVGLYDNLRVVAKLEEVDQDTGVFFLQPISTEVE